jgi:hypothetical protein
MHLIAGLELQEQAVSALLSELRREAQGRTAERVTLRHFLEIQMHRSQITHPEPGQVA